MSTTVELRQLSDQLWQLNETIKKIAENTKPPEPQPDPDLNLVANITENIADALHNALNIENPMTKAQELRDLETRIRKVSQDFAEQANSSQNKNKI